MSARGVLRVAEGGRLLFWCPGCKEMHQVMAGEGTGPRWGFNGDYDRPTFTPSIRVRGIRSPSRAEIMTDDEEREYDAIFAQGGREAVFNSRFGSCCHSFVTDGLIQFLGDCTHGLSGQTVPLEAAQ